MLGNSRKETYDNVAVKSDCWNPAWLGTTLDGQLQKAAKAIPLEYEARIHCKLQALTWVVDESGFGSWQKASEQQITLISIFMHFRVMRLQLEMWMGVFCSSNHKITDEEVQGGMDIWWNKNVEYVQATLQTHILKTHRLNAQGQSCRRGHSPRGKFAKE